MTTHTTTAFDTHDYTSCNRPEFMEAYCQKRIHPDDVFGHTIARLFYGRIPASADFCAELYAALTFIDWIHPEGKYVRAFWDEATTELLEVLGDTRAYRHDALATRGCVSPAIAAAMRAEGWEYMPTPSLLVHTGEDSDAGQQDDSDEWELLRGDDDRKPDDDAFLCWQPRKKAEQPFTGLSHTPLLRDFEMAAVRAFGDKVQRNGKFGVPVWNALAETVWENSAGERIAYGSRAADSLVIWMAGNDRFKTACTLHSGLVTRPIAEAMQAQGWTWTGEKPDWFGEHTFVEDMMHLYGDWIRNDATFCLDLYAMLNNSEWYNDKGELAAFGGRSLGSMIASLRCKGWYLDWYCSDCGPGAGKEREDFYAAMASKGWYAWRCAPDRFEYTG